MSLAKNYYYQQRHITPDEDYCKAEYTYFFPGIDETKEWAVFQILITYIPHYEVAQVDGACKEPDGRSMFHYFTALTLYARDTEGTLTDAEMYNIETCLASMHQEMNTGQWKTAQHMLDDKIGEGVFTANELTFINSIRHHIDNYVAAHYA